MISLTHRKASSSSTSFVKAPSTSKAAPTPLNQDQLDALSSPRGQKFLEALLAKLMTPKKPRKEREEKPQKKFTPDELKALGLKEVHYQVVRHDKCGRRLLVTFFSLLCFSCLIFSISIG